MCPGQSIVIVASFETRQGPFIRMLMFQEINLYICNRLECSISLHLETYFSAGFYEADGSNTNIGRGFNITFHNVTFDSVNGNLTITKSFSLKDDPGWLNCKPNHFVWYFIPCLRNMDLCITSKFQYPFSLA